MSEMAALAATVGAAAGSAFADGGAREEARGQGKEGKEMTAVEAQRQRRRSRSSRNSLSGDAGGDVGGGVPSAPAIPPPPLDAEVSSDFKGGGGIAKDREKTTTTALTATAVTTAATATEVKEQGKEQRKEQEKEQEKAAVLITDGLFPLFPRRLTMKRAGFLRAQQRRLRNKVLDYPRDSSARVDLGYVRRRVIVHIQCSEICVHTEK